MDYAEYRKRQYERLWCEHCSCKIAKSTWYVHYQKFFDSTSGMWKEESSSPHARRPDFNFSEESSEEVEDCSAEEDVIINVRVLFRKNNYKQHMLPARMRI